LVAPFALWNKLKSSYFWRNAVNVISTRIDTKKIICGLVLQLYPWTKRMREVKWNPYLGMVNETVSGCGQYMVSHVSGKVK
jgi:hypothetical protein